MKYYTTSQAANHLGYSSAATVRKLIQRKGFTFQKHGSDWLISEKELKMLEQAVKPRRRKES